MSKIPHFCVPLAKIKAEKAYKIKVFRGLLLSFCVGNGVFTSSTTAVGVRYGIQICDICQTLRLTSRILTTALNRAVVNYFIQISCDIYNLSMCMTQSRCMECIVNWFCYSWDTVSSGSQFIPVRIERRRKISDDRCKCQETRQLKAAFRSW